MKKYFAKYLPVEGEIKEGDTHISEIQEKVSHHVFTSAHNYTEEQAKYIGLSKVKLFLCSRDIQVGDEVTVHWNDGEITQETVQKHNYWLSTELAYKVIGEISPEAKWVKEGDEFDTSQLSKKAFTLNPFGEGLWIGVGLLEKVNFGRNEHGFETKKVVIKIECPCCGTFK